MRKIKVEKWTAKNAEGKEVDENILNVLNVLISNKKPEELPRGLDKFRLYGRISKAFEKADKSGTLQLEEADYTFLKKMIESDVVSIWGTNPNISKAVEDFIEAKEE